MFGTSKGQKDFQELECPLPYEKCNCEGAAGKAQAENRAYVVPTIDICGRGSDSDVRTSASAPIDKEQRRCRMFERHRTLSEGLGFMKNPIFRSIKYSDVGLASQASRQPFCHPRITYVPLLLTCQGHVQQSAFGKVPC